MSISHFLDFLPCTHTVDYSKMMETVMKMAAELEEMKAERKRNAEAAAGPPPRPKPTKYLCGGKGADDFTEVRWSGVRERQLSCTRFCEKLRKVWV